MNIILKDIKLYGYHGVQEWERLLGTEFLINLNLTLKPGIEINRLEDTVDYAEVYKILCDEFYKPEALLEVLIIRIKERLFQSFIQITQIQLTIFKTNPPIPGFTGMVGISYES